MSLAELGSLTLEPLAGVVGHDRVANARETPPPRQPESPAIDDSHTAAEAGAALSAFLVQINGPTGDPSEASPARDATADASLAPASSVATLPLPLATSEPRAAVGTTETRRAEEAGSFRAEGVTAAATPQPRPEDAVPTDVGPSAGEAEAALSALLARVPAVPTTLPASQEAPAEDVSQPPPVPEARPREPTAVAADLATPVAARTPLPRPDTLPAVSIDEPVSPSPAPSTAAALSARPAASIVVDDGSTAAEAGAALSAFLVQGRNDAVPTAAFHGPGDGVGSTTASSGIQAGQPAPPSPAAEAGQADVAAPSPILGQPATAADTATFAPAANRPPDLATTTPASGPSDATVGSDPAGDTSTALAAGDRSATGPTPAPTPGTGSPDNPSPTGTVARPTPSPDLRDSRRPAEPARDAAASSLASTSSTQQATAGAAAGALTSRSTARGAASVTADAGLSGGGANATSSTAVEPDSSSSAASPDAGSVAAATGTASALEPSQPSAAPDQAAAVWATDGIALAGQGGTPIPSTFAAGLAAAAGTQAAVRQSGSPARPTSEKVAPVQPVLPGETATEGKPGGALLRRAQAAYAVQAADPDLQTPAGDFV